MAKKCKIKDYQVSDEIVVYVNEKDKRVTMHVKYGTTDKDWVIMDCVPKKAFPFINMCLQFLVNQQRNFKMPDAGPMHCFPELYRSNTFKSKGSIAVYSSYCRTSKSDAYMVCNDVRLGNMYRIGKFRDIMAAYQVALVVCAIAPTELLNKRFKEVKNEKNKLSIGHRE